MRASGTFAYSAAQTGAPGPYCSRREATDGECLGVIRPICAKANRHASLHIPDGILQIFPITSSELWIDTLHQFQYTLPMVMRTFVLALVLPIALPATILTNASDFTNGFSSQAIGGLNWTSSPGNFNKKTVAGFTGVGITGGATNDEIDVGEIMIATTATAPIAVRSFTLGVLFDGPEFNDVQEVAQVTITSLSLGTLSYTLTNVYQPIPPGPDLAVWSGLGTLVNLSPSTENGAAVWKVSNPFGSLNDIVRIQFTALAGTCGTGPCTNQSDFTLNQMEYDQVPEAPTAMFIAIGLAALLGTHRRRRSGPVAF